MIGEFKKNLREERARLEGRGVSRARMVKQAQDIAEISGKLATDEARHRAPQSMGAGVRMLDGKPMVFFSDGSLRHAMGKKTTKAARKALKRARRAAQKPS